MRADVSGPSARRALGSVCAGAAALLQGDEDGLSFVITDILASSPTADALDAALLTSAELFTQIAEARLFAPGRLVTILASALEDLGSTVPAALMGLVCDYLADDFSSFSDGCENVVELHDPALLLRGSLEILAGAVRWRAKDLGSSPVEDARALCLSVARFSQGDV